MKRLSLLIWVTQFGFSILFPMCFFLLLGTWLQNRFVLGSWVLILCGVLGVLTTVSTVRSSLRALRKAAQECEDSQQPPAAFNDHD